MTFEATVTAVQSADTLEAIQAVLEQCTKSLMVRVYEAITGRIAGFKKSFKKEDLAYAMAKSILGLRAEEAFKAMSFDEKYEMLKTCSDLKQRINYASKFTTEELRVIVSRLGLPAKYNEGEDCGLQTHILYAIAHELEIQEQVTSIGALMSGDDAEALKAKMIVAQAETLKRLLEKYGVSYEEDNSLYSIHMQDALYRYYISSKQTRTQAESETSTIETDAATVTGEVMTREEFMNIVGRYKEFLREASAMKAVLGQALDMLNEQNSLTDDEAEYRNWFEDVRKSLEGILD